MTSGTKTALLIGGAVAGVYFLNRSKQQSVLGATASVGKDIGATVWGSLSSLASAVGWLARPRVPTGMPRDSAIKATNSGTVGGTLANAGSTTSFADFFGANGNLAADTGFWSINREQFDA